MRRVCLSLRACACVRVRVRVCVRQSSRGNEEATGAKKKNTSGYFTVGWRCRVRVSQGHGGSEEGRAERSEFLRLSAQELGVGVVAMLTGRKSAGRK